jgi:D-sedoheptulose 7-phosphate isomerase
VTPTPPRVHQRESTAGIVDPTGTITLTQPVTLQLQCVRCKDWFPPTRRVNAPLDPVCGHCGGPMSEFTNALQAMRLACAALDQPPYHAAIDRIAQRYAEALTQGGMLLFAGNGGSAADAQHVAAEFVGRLDRPRQPLPALALTVDTSVLTALGNDYGFDQVFARQVEALARPGDVLVVHSTSGNSENLVQAVAAARSRELYTIALLGQDGGRLRSLVHEAVCVPSDDGPTIQQVHLLLQHVLVRMTQALLLPAT